MRSNSTRIHKKNPNKLFVNIPHKKKTCDEIQHLIALLLQLIFEGRCDVSLFYVLSTKNKATCTSKKLIICVFDVSRISERSRAAAGKSGLMSRLFGTTNPDIVRDQSTRALDTKILADKENIEKAKTDLE